MAINKGCAKAQPLFAAYLSLNLANDSRQGKKRFYFNQLTRSEEGCIIMAERGDDR